MNSIFIKIGVLVLGIFALAAGLWLSLNQSGNQLLIDEDVGFVYPEAREIGDFQLVDHDGQAIDQRYFQKKWWLVYFGFTFCPDACPTALNDMKKTKALLDEKTNKKIGFAFISVDPGRDSPARLKQYVHYFDSEFVAATGNLAALQALATKVGVIFITPENSADENYLVDHSTSMLLWNPEANLQAILKAPHEPKKLATGIKRILATF